MAKPHDSKESTKPLQVIIRNLPPSKHWLIEWIPLAVAVLALIVSTVSFHFSQVQYANSSRPFIWATEVTGPEGFMPDWLDIHVTNAPAFLVQRTFELRLASVGVGEEEEVVYFDQDAGHVKFPQQAQDTGGYRFGKFNEARDRADKEGRALRRSVRIQYSGLSGGKEYYYESVSIYDKSQKRWQVKTEKAS
jgi:hypothetical protein